MAKFIDSGTMDPKEMLGKYRLHELPHHVRIFFERMLVSRSTLQLVLEAQRRGINVERILEEILYPETKKELIQWPLWKKARAGNVPLYP